jgi:hypothetical protein
MFTIGVIKGDPGVVQQWLETQTEIPMVNNGKTWMISENDLKENDDSLNIFQAENDVVLEFKTQQ